MKAKLLALGAAALTLVASPPASAHHAFTMFALDKVETVSGTVSNYAWSMPHVWLYLMLPSKTGGAPEEWGFEAHAPNLVARKGWKSSTFKVGDKISIAMHPKRDGTKAGSLIYATLADGTQLWNADSVNAP